MNNIRIYNNNITNNLIFYYVIMTLLIKYIKYKINLLNILYKSIDT